MRNEKIKNMVLVSLGAVILALGAWITVPFVIPFTMQTFALTLLLMSFGGRIAFCSIILYIALGMVGIPVFSGFNSGVSAVIGPTGGFIIGFVLAGGLYWTLERIIKRDSRLSYALPFLSLLLCYACGTMWYMFYTSFSSGFFHILSVCVLPYILPDIIKVVFAILVSRRIRGLIKL